MVFSSNDRPFFGSVIDSSLWLSVKHKKGFTGHKVPAKPFAIGFYTHGIPTRLLTFGIGSVFAAFPLAQWRCKKTDISDHSGGTVTVLHRVPFAGYLQIYDLIIYGVCASTSRNFSAENFGFF